MKLIFLYSMLLSGVVFSINDNSSSGHNPENSTASDINFIQEYSKSENESAGSKNISVVAPASPLKTASEMFNERGFNKSNGFSFDENEIINDFSGNLIYSFPLYNYMLGGDLNFDMKLNYNGSITHNVIVGSVSYQNNANLNRFNNRYTLTFPEWILEINGFAVQVFNFETNYFNKTGASSLSGSEVNAVIPGYHFDNELREVSASNKDVINILTGDGSVISMQNDNYDSNNLWNNYIGSYSYKGKELHYKAIVSYRSPIVSGEYAGYKERNMILLTGNGLEYYFEEKIKDFEDYKSDSIVNARINPMMMYLKEIRDRFGRILQIGYISNVPFTISGNEEIKGRDLFGSVTYSGISSDLPGIAITMEYGQGGAKLFHESELNGNYTLYFERPVNYRPYGDNKIQRGCISKILNILNQKTEFDYQIYGRRFTNAFNPFGTGSTSITLDLNDLRRISSVTSQLGLERTYTYLASQTDEINLVTYLTGEENRKYVMSDSGEYKGMGRDPFFTNMLASRLEYKENLISTTGFSYLFDPGERTNIPEVPVDQSDEYESGKTITYNNRPAWDTTADFRIERHYKIYTLYDSANHYAYSPDNDGSVKLIKEIIQNFEDYTPLKTTDFTFETGSFNSSVHGYNGSFLLKTKKESYPGVYQYYNEWKWDYTYRDGNYDSLVSETKETDPLNSYTINRDTSFMIKYRHKQFISDYTYNSALIPSYFYKIHVPVSQIRYTAAGVASQKKTFEYIPDTTSAEGYYGQLISEKTYKFPSFTDYIETEYAYCKDDTSGKHLFAGTGIFPYKEGNLKLVKSNDRETRYYYNPVNLSEVYKNNDPDTEFPEGIPLLKYKIKFNDGSVLDTFALIWDHRLPVRIENIIIENNASKSVAVNYKTYTLDGSPSKMFGENKYLTQFKYEPVHRINSITLPGDFSTLPDSTAIKTDTHFVYIHSELNSTGWGYYDDNSDSVHYYTGNDIYEIYGCGIFRSDINKGSAGFRQFAFMKFTGDSLYRFASIDSANLCFQPIFYEAKYDNNVIYHNQFKTFVSPVENLNQYTDDCNCSADECESGAASIVNIEDSVYLDLPNSAPSADCFKNHELDLKDMLISMNNQDKILNGFVIKPVYTGPETNPQVNFSFILDFLHCEDNNEHVPPDWFTELLPKLSVYGKFDISDTLRIPVIRGGTIKYSYDDENHTADVYSVRSSLSNERSRIKYSIDQSGNVKQKDIYVSENSYNSYKYKYNYMNKPSVSFDALGDSTRMIYDGLDRMTVTINPDTSRVDNSFGYAGNFANYFGTIAGVTFFQRFTDEEGNYFDKYTDAVGNLRREIKYMQEDPNQENLTSMITDYNYDSLYRVTQVKTPEGKIISYSYDGYGRQSKRITPDAGQTDYIYDKNNNLTYTQDANQRAADNFKYTFRNYDGLNRLTGIGEAKFEIDAPTDGSQYISDTPENYLTVNVYDTITNSIVNELFAIPSGYSSPLYTKGNLVATAYRTRSSDDWNFKYYKYDVRGRVIKMWNIISGFDTLITENNFNSQDQLTNYAHIRNQEVKRFWNLYDYAGRFEKVKYYTGNPEEDIPDNYTEFANYTYNENSQLQEQMMFESVKNQFNYDNRNRITEFINTDGIFGYTNSYFRNGNVKSQNLSGTYKDNFIRDDELGFNYTYDKSNRLLKSALISEQSKDDYKLINTYDKDGNLLTLKRYGSNENLIDDFNYVFYSGTNKVRSVSDTSAEFNYDYNGNVSKDEISFNYEMKYDHRNLLMEMKNRYTANHTYRIRYYYDESGNRIRKYILKKTEPDAESPDDWDNPGEDWEIITNEYYSRDIYGNTVAIYNDSSIVQWNVIAGTEIGQINHDSTIYYYLKDHLGSVRAVVKSDGEVISAEDYDCWGYPLQDRIRDYNGMKYKFTGKEAEKQSDGYYYFGARYYNSIVGRWGSVDVLASIEPSKTPYHYTSNNPINRIDPEGLDDIYYKDGTEVDRRVSGFCDFDWLFGDTYYVQSESGNVEYNGGLYFEALSEETVKQFAGWNKVYANWESSYSEEGFITRLSEAVENAPSSLIDRYEFVLYQAQSGGQLDQKRFLNEKTIYVYNNIAMNQQEAGNTIFGSAINILGIDLGIANIGGHMYSVYANKKFDEYNEVQAYKIGYFNFNSNSPYFRNRAAEKYR